MSCSDHRLQRQAFMKRSPNHQLVGIAGAAVVAAASLGLVGCSHPSRPAEPAAVAAPTEPRFEKSRVDPHFRRALADYRASVREAELLGGPSSEMALRRAVLLLSDALPLIPHARAQARAAAMALRSGEAVTAIAAPLVESSALVNALDQTDRALSELAMGPYASVPGVGARAAEFRRAAQLIEPGVSLGRQRGLVLDALTQAGATMQAMEQAIGRGRVPPE
jgi:hypothetical protein